VTQPADIVDASVRYQAWLAALKDRAMLQTHNQAQAMMRAVLLALRRHMTADNVFAFADALPPLPRGIFVEGWRPTEVPTDTSPTALLAEVTRMLAPHHVPPDTIVEDALAVIGGGVGSAQMASIHAALPDGLRPLMRPSADQSS